MEDELTVDAQSDVSSDPSKNEEGKPTPVINEPPPLTVKNAVKYIKGLRHPLGIDYFGDRLELSDAQHMKLQQQSFESPDEEFKAYMTEWIEGEKEGEEKREEPRWRRLIWALDVVEEDAQADQIRGFAEPHKGK